MVFTEKTLSSQNKWYSLNDHMLKQYGEKVYRLSLNGGMTCPNRDGTLDHRGCIFCSQGGSGDFAESPALSITTQIEEGKKRIAGKSSARRFIAYFQAYTNTYADITYLRRVFMEAVQHPDIVILSIATRPDCLSEGILELLSEIQQIKPVWIELGLQTIHPVTSEWIRSRFSLNDFKTAVFHLSARNIPVIVHLILGLKGENREMILESVDYIAALPVAGVKLQLLHILEQTDLASEFRTDPFPLLSMDAYTDLIIDCLEHLPQNIVIHRLTGDGPRDQLIAPLWSTNKKSVLNTITKKLKERNSYQGKWRDSING